MVLLCLMKGVCDVTALTRLSPMWWLLFSRSKDSSSSSTACKPAEQTVRHTQKAALFQARPRSHGMTWWHKACSHGVIGTHITPPITPANTNTHTAPPDLRPGAKQGRQRSPRTLYVRFHPSSQFNLEKTNCTQGGLLFS